MLTAVKKKSRDPRFSKSISDLSPKIMHNPPIENPFKVGDFVLVPEGTGVLQWHNVKHLNHRFTLGTMEVEIVDIQESALLKETQWSSTYWEPVIAFEDEAGTLQCIKVTMNFLNVLGIEPVFMNVNK